jgi:methylated-DNA-protein-cysteine methyltransferase related protein
MAVGLCRNVVADSHWMDCVVNRGSEKSSKKRVGKNSVRSIPDQSSKMRMRIEIAIRRIPKGKVSTYGAVGRAAGFPQAARQVAKVLHRGFELPWQRVLGAGGQIKLRGDSAIEQRLRLEAEGVRFRGRKVDMKAHEFKFTRGSTGKKR